MLTFTELRNVASKLGVRTRDVYSVPVILAKERAVEARRPAGIPMNPFHAKMLHNYRPLTKTVVGRIICDKVRVTVSRKTGETVGYYRERFYNPYTQLYETTDMISAYRDGECKVIKRHATRYSAF